MADFLTGAPGSALPNVMTSDDAESQIRKRGIAQPTSLAPAAEPVQQQAPSAPPNPPATGVGRGSGVSDDPILANILNGMKQPQASQPSQQGSGDPILDGIIGNMRTQMPKVAPAESVASKPTPVAAPSDQGDFSRNFEKSYEQGKQLLYGTAALVGDTVGADSLKDYGLKGYQEQEAKVKGLTADSDSFTNVMEGKGDIVEWMQGAAGYLTGQVLEFGASALAGAAIGSAAPGAGTVGGAVTGFLGKEAVKKGIRGKIASMMEQQLAKSVAAGMTEQEAAKAVGRTVMAGLGAKAGAFLASSTQELGSIYGDALEESAKTGQDYSLGRIWMTGIGAAALDSAMDWVGFNKLKGAFGSDKAAKNFLKEAFTNGAREGATEGMQTAIERFGAGKSLTNQEAIREYIDSATIGAFGGAAIGTSSAAASRIGGNKDTNAPEIDSTKVAFDSGTLIRTAQTDPNVLAALHRTSDDTVRAKIEKLASEAGVTGQFREALADNTSLAAGQQILRGNQQFATRLKDSINAFTPTREKDNQTVEANAPSAPAIQEPIVVTPRGDALVNPGQVDAYQQFGRPQYDNLQKAAVTAEDSLAVQEAAPEIKPVVVGTKKQVDALKKSKKTQQKVVYESGKKAYIIDPVGVQSVYGGTMEEAVAKAKVALDQGGDAASKILGYPKREGVAKAKTVDVAVTKQGDVTTNVPEMVQQGAEGNLAYAAEGKPEEALPIAQNIGEALKQKAKAKRGLTNPQAMTAKANELVSKAKAGKLTPEQRAAAEQTVAEGRALVEQMKAMADAADKTADAATKGKKVRGVAKKAANVAPSINIADEFKKVAAELEFEEELKNEPKTTAPVVDEAPKITRKQSVAPKLDIPAGRKINRSDAQKALKGLSEYTRQTVGRRVEDLFRSFDEMPKDKVKQEINTLLAAVDKVIAATKEDQSPISQWTKRFYSNNLKKRLLAAKKDIENPIQTTKTDAAIKGHIEFITKKSREGMTNINRALVDVENRDAAKELEEASVVPQDVSEDEAPAQRGRPKKSKDPLVLFNGKPFTEYSLGEFAETDDREVLLSGGGLGYISEDKWFKSFDDAMKKAVKNKDEELKQNLINSIKDTEFEEYQVWKASRSNKIAMLKQKYGGKEITRDQIEELMADPQWVFGDAVFMRATLDTFVNPGLAAERGTISEGEARLLQAKGAGKNGDLVWFQSLENAIISRPDLEEKLLSEEITADERVRFEAWQKHESRAADLAHRMRAIAEAMKASGGIFEELGSGEFEERTLYEYNAAVARFNETMNRDFAEGAVNLLLDVEQDAPAEHVVSGSTTVRGKLRRGVGNIIAANVQIDQEVQRLTAGLENAPEIVTAISWRETPERISKLIEEAGGDEAVPKGFFDEETGTVYLFSENIEDTADLQFTLFHEMNGHYGLRGLFGNSADLNSFLNKSYVTNPRVRARVQELQAKHPELKSDRLLAIEEAVADLAAEGKDVGLFQKFMGVIQAGLRKIGWDSLADAMEDFSGVEFAQKLKAARDYVRSGKDFVSYGADTETLFVRAGHVSRAKFDQFSEQYIGRGMGLAYGHGWYFYSDANRVNGLILSVASKDAPVSFSIGGKAFSNTQINAFSRAKYSTEKDVSNTYLYNSLRSFATKDGVTTDDITNAKEQAISDVLSEWNEIADVIGVDEDNNEAVLDRVLANIRNAQDVSMSITPREVFVYDVDLNDARFGNMALWHSKMSDQPDAVQRFMKDAISKIEPFNLSDDPTFGDVHNGLKYTLIDSGMSEAEASRELMNELRDAGVPGNRHFVNSMEERGVDQYDGSDVVVYDNRVINISEVKRVDEAKPLLKRGNKKNAVEINAMKGGKFVGLATFNPVLKEWTVFTGADVEGGEFVTRQADTVEDAIAMLKDTGGKLTFDEAINNKTLTSTRLTLLDKGNDSKVVSKIKAKMRDAIIASQNMYLPVKHAVFDAMERIGIDDAANVWQKIVLYNGRAGSRIEQFRKDFVEPITELAKKVSNKGGSLVDIDTYLYAMHAQERNKTLAEREAVDGKNSGISDEDAKSLLEAYDKKPFAAELKEISSLIDKMSESKIGLMEESGMIGKAQAEGLRKWKHYVNLSGFDEVEDGETSTIGNRFNQKSKAYQSAKGRYEAATAVLARTINDYQGKIVRAEKNRVAQATLAFVQEVNDPEFASIVTHRDREVLVDGKVRVIHDPFIKDEPGIMVVKVEGKDYIIDFADKSENSFADAMTNMYNMGAPNAVLAFMSKWNQVLSRLITVWAPDWAVVNGIRDIQSAYLNMRADLGKEKAERMAKDTVKNIKDSMRYFLGKMSAEEKAQMDAIYDRLNKAGGMTHFLQLDSVAEEVSKIESEISSLSAKRLPGAKAVGKVVDLLEKFNGAIEAAPRVAAFKVLIENGVSEDQAAQYAKELTVNFNLRGKNQWLSSFYLFFNPAIQGTERLLRAVTSPTGRKLAAGLFGLGIVTGLFGRAAGGTDDDGIDRIDKISDFKRATSIVLFPDVPGGAIPLPYGWNFFHAAGVYAADAMFGGKSGGDAAFKTLKAAIAAFSPIGGNDAQNATNWFIKTLTPQIAKPVIEYALNDNSFGSPVRKTDSPYAKSKEPSSQQHFESVAPASRILTEKLNKMFGGNEYRSSGFFTDINPAFIDQMVRGYLPGLPTATYDVANESYRKFAIGEKTRDTEWGQYLSKMPFVKRLSATSSPAYDNVAFRKLSETIETAYEEAKRLGPGDNDNVFKEHPNLIEAHAVIKHYGNVMQKQNTTVKQIKRDERFTDEQKVEAKNNVRDFNDQSAKVAVKRLIELGYGKYL